MVFFLDLFLYYVVKIVEINRIKIGIFFFERGNFIENLLVI